MDLDQKPIWILHICNTMDIGGDYTFLMNYFKNIDKNRVSFAFVVQREEDYEHDSEIYENNGRIHKVRPMNKNPILFMKDLFMILDNHPEYKIVHAHMNHRNGFALALCKLKKIPVRISHAHARGKSLPLMKAVRIKFLKFLIKIAATDLMACSIDAGKYLYGKNKFFIIRNAISLKDYTYSEEIRIKMRKSFSLTDELVVGHVGNFSAVKNYHFILDVFSNLPKESKLILVGDGALIQSVNDYAEELGIQERVIYTGVRNDVNNLMQAFDVFLFPSFREGLGLVAIEAQAAGLPVFCSNGIPREAAITKQFKSLPLEIGPSNWAKEINLKAIDRIDTSSQIVKAGYDITEQVKVLEEYYFTRFVTIIEKGD